MMRQAILLAVVLVSAPLAAAASDWSRAKDDYANDPSFAASKAICARVLGVRAPRADLPTAAEAAALKGCDAEALYYGEKIAANPRRARLCAFVQSDGGERDSDEFFSGQTILMMLYANGRGVKPDLDLATHYACNIRGAPAESDGRVHHLADLKAKGPGKARFDFCDDITSGLAGGYCAARDQTLADIRRQGQLDGLAHRAVAIAGPAYAVLRKAAYGWADARSGNEVDTSGTARAQLAIDEEERMRDAFVRELLQVLDGKVGAAAGGKAQAADAALNAAYAKLKARGADAAPAFADIQTASAPG